MYLIAMTISDILVLFHQGISTKCVGVCIICIITSSEMDGNIERKDAQCGHSDNGLRLS